MPAERLMCSERPAAPVPAETRTSQNLHTDPSVGGLGGRSNPAQLWKLKAVGEEPRGRKSRIASVLNPDVVDRTLSLMVGRSRRETKRKPTTGRAQRRVVRKTVSQTLGWLREFLPVPGRHVHGQSRSGSDAPQLGPEGWAPAAPVPTEEGEVGGEDEEHPVAAHGEGEGEVRRQAAPGEEVVDRRPVMGVQEQLGGGGAPAQAPHVHVGHTRSGAHSPGW